MMIENWKSAHKMYSVQIAAALGAIAGLEPFFPQISEHLPPGWGAVFAVLFVVARLARQDKLKETTPQELWDETLKRIEKK
jgi:hypothetical protein